MTQKCLGFEAFPGLGRTLAALWFRSAALSFPIHEGEGSTTCRDCPGRVGKTLLRVQPRARGPSLRWPRALVLGESRLVLLAVTQARGKSPPDPTPSTSEELTLPGFECPRVTGRAGWGRGPAVPVCSWACRCGPPPHTHPQHFLWRGAQPPLWEPLPCLPEPPMGAGLQRCLGSRKGGQRCALTQQPTLWVCGAKALFCALGLESDSMSRGVILNDLMEQAGSKQVIG